MSVLILILLLMLVAAPIVGAIFQGLALIVALPVYIVMRLCGHR